MKIKRYGLFVLLNFLLFSCQEKVENVSESSEETAPAVVEYKDDPKTFKEELYNLPLRKLPISDSISTNEAIMSINPINVFTFKLDEIYENWFKEEYNYQLISGYRLNISEDFYTAVLKIKVGEIDQEHRLINYDLDGKVIASTRVAIFSDGELEYTKTKANIDKDKINLTHFFITKNSDEKEENQSIIKIEPNGNLKEASENEVLLDCIAKELKLDFSKRIQKLETVKKQPNNSEETIAVIPEIVEEGEEYFLLNSHIVIYNTQSQKITHRFFESAKTNNWVSDAIRLDKITIDNNPYLVKENTNAFGVMVEYFGSSRVNPYYKKTVSLFVKENGQLKNILHHYTFEENKGEWNGNCEGAFDDEKTEFIFTKDKTNDYFDIIVKKTLTKTTNFETEIGDCDYNEEIKRETSILKFDGNQYQ